MIQMKLRGRWIAQEKDEEMSEKSMFPKWELRNINIVRYPAVAVFEQNGELLSLDVKNIDEFIAILQEVKDAQVK